MPIGHFQIGKKYDFSVPLKKILIPILCAKFRKFMFEEIGNPAFKKTFFHRDLATLPGSQGSGGLCFPPSFLGKVPNWY